MSIELITPQAIPILAKNVGAWVSATHASLAREKAAQIYGKNADQAIIYTDGRKGRAPEEVKPFGLIVYAPGRGPMKAAIDMALSIIRATAPTNADTGRYTFGFQFYVNGDPVAGVPDGDRLGPKSNVQIANLVPYASMQEIQIPRGVLYAAYTALNRAFGQRLVLAYGYRLPRGAFTQDQLPGRKDKPSAVPVLMIASPGGKIRRSVTAPGATRRSKRRLTGRARARRLRR